VPITIAIHLSKTGRYQEAQRWFHFFFDPTTNSPEPAPERFWKVQPFRTSDVRQIEEILVNLSSEAGRELKADTVDAIKRAGRITRSGRTWWRRYRHSAYMYKNGDGPTWTMRCWGDALFREDTAGKHRRGNPALCNRCQPAWAKAAGRPVESTLRPMTYAT